MKKQKRRYLNKNELLTICKKAAYEKRITRSSSWFGCQVMSAYTLWKDEKFGATKISRVLNGINDKEMLFNLGEYDVEEVRKLMDEKYHLKFTFEDDIVRTKSKDKVESFMRKKALENDNQIVTMTDRYLLMLLHTLIAEGFGEKRMCRVQSNMFALINNCLVKGKIFELHRELKDYAGIELEKPKDYMEGVS